jgi:hypothetical protein
MGGGRGEYIRTIVLPTNGMQVVIKGEPHFPQNDRVTDISFPHYPGIQGLGREDDEPGFPEAPGDT